jgi:hypothetical protein
MVTFLAFFSTFGKGVLGGFGRMVDVNALAGLAPAGSFRRDEEGEEYYNKRMNEDANHDLV